jgi:murein DD-endopeptidase MepM/ murein hydrolase activator NlpD
LTSKKRLYASVFYAHLDTAGIRRGVWADVRAGQRLGTVGKTGNARGDRVRPHLHLEVIVQPTMAAAIAEQHIGSDESVPQRVEVFFEALDSRCLEPNGFRPRSGRVRSGRRADPFLVLTCLASEKPDYRGAPAPLREASRPWSELYSARAFDVDRGPDDLLLQRRSKKR